MCLVIVLVVRLVVSVLLLSLASASIGSTDMEQQQQQSARVRGTLLCGGRPASGVRVKLFEEELEDQPGGWLMDETVSDERGRFEVRGSESEPDDIRPVLNIYHHCNEENGIPPKELCYKKTSIEIPSKYIARGNVMRIMTFNVDLMDLAREFADEGRECL